MKIAIFGASGFAGEVADVCEALGHAAVLVDRDPAGARVRGLRVVHESEVPELEAEGYQFAIGIGTGSVRARIARIFPALPYPNLVHPSATFGREQRNRLAEGRGNIVTAGACFTNGIETGDFGIYNLNCTVGHDGIVEDFVTVSPGANISGNVHLRREAYVGTGAAILQGEAIEQKLVVGARSTVGAGAVVTKDVAPDTVVAGVPATPLGE